jgi:hypothetical protein
MAWGQNRAQNGHAFSARYALLEFLPTDNPAARHCAADIIGYLVGYANLTNTRSLALLGSPDASAYELLFSFSSPEEKSEFPNLVLQMRTWRRTASLSLRRPPPKKSGMLAHSKRSYPMTPSPVPCSLQRPVCG